MNFRSDYHQKMKHVVHTFVPADIITLGGFEENQCVILGVGRHVTLHQHQPAMVAWRAQ